MKRLYILVALVFATISVSAQDLVVASYNIRNDNSGDTKRGNGWAQRCPIICDQIEWNDIDIFGAQEVKRNQIDDMLKELEGYSFVGVGRDDGKDKGEFSPVFYKTERFKLLDQGTFWISETPEKVGIKGWDAALPRICSYAHLQDKVTKKKFWFFNLHMDHIGVEARKEGAKLIARKITEMCGNEPAMVSGDFNVDQNNEAYKTIVSQGVLTDSYEKSAKRYIQNGTFNSFNPNLYTKSRIDHIFVTKQVNVSHYAVLTDGYWTENTMPAKSIKGEAAPQEISFQKYIHRCPSDHYPVMIRVTFDKK
ncbi:MAG: endonuclease/exonuclease/phosphatase family protein [Alistipes sp.]|nr:endonuclease/exonuclease/phosphatase family protein [Alistipes sp.]